jgi:hypothetical protein
LKLQHNNNLLVLNLNNAIVRPIKDNTGTEIGFNIQTLNGGANVLADGSNFTRADIESAICDCAGSGGGGGGDSSPTQTICAYREILTNGTWSPPANTRGFAYYVKTSTGTAPTITDANSNTTSLDQGEIGEYSIDVSRDIAMSTSFTITAGADDVIIINYTRVCP